MIDRRWSMNSIPAAHLSITAPPATSSTMPVIQPASPEARKTAAHATSSGVPQTLEWVTIHQRRKLLLGNSLEVSFGENRLGSNTIHPNAIRAGLRRDILGHEFDASLRDGVRDRRPEVRTGAQQPRRS